ncbi:MAG TPA: enoyl-CoA hydratase-related protein [Chloroflexia bacterium]|nr:enoyl-CoA hydratase-related protein [Chloroflexia bacterium]
MAYTAILLEREAEGQIAVITVNRPDKLNALNLTVLQELSAAFDELAADETVRAVVLTGAGERAFVAGADIAELNGVPDPAHAASHARLGQAVAFKIERLPKPVIVAINGFALGGGLELAMAGDIRIAAESARVGQPEINLGIIPGFGGTQRLPRLVGRGMAKLLIYEGGHITAQEAYRIGLVDKVVPLAQLQDEARSLARTLATKPPIALAMAKAAINEGVEVDLDRGCGIEAAYFGLLFSTEDRAEGTAAFLEKRKASFKGK